MDTLPTPSPLKDNPLMFAQAFAATLAPRLPPARAQARMSVAVVGHGAWSFAIADAAVPSPQWDESADLQLLCDFTSLESMVTGNPFADNAVFLVSGDDAFIDSLGGLFAGGGSPLSVRLGVRS